MPTTRYLAVLISLTLIGASVNAAEDKQQQPLGVLKSDAPKADKALACKQLAIYGKDEAVPALAALLADPELSSWARIALEAIPGPAADDALRQALNTVKGLELAGVIHSIADRGDAKGVEPIIARLKDADAQVASAAAIALGKLGGDAASAALEQAMANSPDVVRDAAAHGCILAAEHYLSAKKPEPATRLYDLVRKADVPKQRKLEGTRGAILARGGAGVELLVENLRSGDQAFINIALGTARELAAPQVTDALIAELPKAASDQQRLIILALADRNDPKALPAVVQAAKEGQTSVRVTAVEVLERLGNVSTIPVLLEAAASDEVALSRAARTTLSRLGGKDVDAELMTRMEQSSGPARKVLIELAEMRRMEGVLPAFIKYTADPDPAVRQAAVEAIGEIGQAAQAADLAKLLEKAQEPRDRAALERSLTALCSRYGAACVPHLLPLARGEEPATRVTALRALSSSGGPEALAAVRAALDDTDESVRDEAVRTLATWPNRWPEDASVLEALAAVAKAPRKPNHQVLALRGYLQFLQGTRKLKAEERLTKASEVFPLITRVEEKRQAISVLSAIGSAGAVPALVTFTGDPGVTEEAAAAIVALVGKNPPGLSAEQRRAALQAVAEKSRNEGTKAKAEELLKK